MHGIILSMLIAVACGHQGETGTIRGVVLNASRENIPVAGSAVVLQAREHDRFLPVAQTTTDLRGWFQFSDLPSGSRYLYLTGASHGEVHYPGPRLVLKPGQTIGPITIAVFDSVHEPSPLVAAQHEITVEPGEGVIKVTETILVSNPSALCYVGPDQEQARTSTLQLSIPSHFEKVTFDREFFGRRFILIDGRLVTNLPWPPGDRELAFTYLIPITGRLQVIERPLDLPCSNLTVRVITEDPDQVACNLRRQTETATERIFEAGGVCLPAGHLIRIELGRMPLPLMAHARWIALGILALSIVAVLLRVYRHHRPGRAGGSASWHTAGAAFSRRCSRASSVKTP